MAKKPSETAMAGRLDLTLTRVIDAPRALLWEAWTKPEHLKQWWAPKPTEVTECEIDLRPGGTFYAAVRMEDGSDFPIRMCYLDIAPMERLVFTDTLLAGWRPSATPLFTFTAIIKLEDQSGKTKCVARLLHKDEADRARHEEAGFQKGWGTAFDQLAEMVKSMKGKV